MADKVDFFASERAKCSFKTNDLSLLIFGSQTRIEQIKRLQKTVEEDPILRFDPNTLGISRAESFMLTCRRTKRIHELIGFNNVEDIDYILRSHIDSQPLCGLHWKMFIPAIKYLGTDKQVKKWLPLAESHQIIGTYAQTELGHGSDVQGLETTAIFDLEKQEFIVNSPSLTATKWWPGELGFTTTHCVAHAQLIIDGRNFGIQSFIIPLRDTETHEPLPGRKMGDIGLKLGYNTKDNGFLRLDNIRIPRENMLMRYAKVSKAGIFSKPKNEKVGYACMMEIRAGLIISSPLVMARALTIGTRYALFRTQFRDHHGQEKKILDYQLQQDKIIPLIAETFGLLAGGRKVVALHHQNLKNIHENEDFSLFKEFHAIASGCKAVYTSKLVESIEKIRLSCGGHGFSAYARFTDLFSEYSPFPTYEGENTVLHLQAARHLVKALKKCLRGDKVSQFVDYLKYVPGLDEERFEPTTVGAVLNIEAIRSCIRYKAARHVSEAAQKLMEGMQKDMTMKESWDEYAGISLVEASNSHIEYFTISSFVELILEAQNESVKAVLSKLCILYGINKILASPGSLFEKNYINGEQFQLFKQAKEVLLKQLRPDSLCLVESFLYSDGCLGALGRSDGKVYETLFEWASNQNPLNKPEIQKAIQAEIRKMREVKTQSGFLPRL